MVHNIVISVENLYWVLYQTLLKPIQLNCWYYYPWGTRKYLSANEFQPFDREAHSAHVLFHFDQEPIWTEDFGEPYDNNWGQSMTVKHAKLLANSEKSLIKKKCCKTRQMLDWYFFYHGLASLDWFRDAQFIDDDAEIKTHFLSFNHIIRHRRCYRIALLARLMQAEVVQRGAISFHGDMQSVLDEIHDSTSVLSDSSRNIIKANLSKFVDLPWKLDNVPITGNSSAAFGHKEYKIWQSSFLHLVNETVYYEPKLHLTEKIFKPIVAKRPFILVGSPGNLAYLRGYGFKTFGQWIDEKYDDIQDPDQRLDAITKQVMKISALSMPQLRDLYNDMLPILEHNKRHFFGDFRKIVITELVDNFDQCIRIWNNGRVDGRELPLHPNLDYAKQLLLR